MSTDKAFEDGQATGEEGDADLDQAIDDLRGVLKKGAEPPAGGGRRAGDTSAGKLGFEDMNGAADKAFPDFDEFDAPSGSGGARQEPGSGESRLDLIMQIPIEVQVVLGSSTMPVSALMKLTEGSTIALERKIGEPVEIVVNGRVIGRGEITVLEGEDMRFGVRLTEVETDRN